MKRFRNMAFSAEDLWLCGGLAAVILFIPAVMILFHDGFLYRKIYGYCLTA
jgi:hypothetical protein